MTKTKSRRRINALLITPFAYGLAIAALILVIWWAHS